MARPALATVDDLELLLGESIADPGQAEARLQQASELVRAYAGLDWLNDAQDELTLVPGAIPFVVCGIVERATQNPTGVTQESTGPFSRSFGPDAASRIYLTDADKRIIRRAAGAQPLAVISTTRGPMETPDVFDYETVADGLSGVTEADDPYSLWP